MAFFYQCFYSKSIFKQRVFLNSKCAKSCEGLGLLISRIHRLRENRDFRRVFQRGQSFATSRLVLYSFPNRLSHYRVGFSVSKKMGNAVVRNRLKRVLRACFYQLEKDLSSVSADFVIICRKPAVDAEFDVLLSDLRKMLNKAKIML